MLFNLRSLNHTQLFLIDGIGALLSAILLWLVYYCRNIFAVPDSMYHQLIAFPVFFACYSLTCLLIKPRSWKIFLAIVTVSNVLYAGYSLLLVSHYADQLTIYGIIYFLLEIVGIIALVYVEISFLKQNRPSTQLH